MGIQRAKHPFQGAIDQILIRQFLAVHIVLAHAFHHIGKQLQARIRRVLFRSLGGIQKYARAYQQIDG